jgi:dTDP-4-amino-4,6-dideoxygalactose transaminase
MKIYYNYLNKEFQNPQKIISAWKRLIKTTDFTLGKFINIFEKKFSKYMGVRYCVSTNNGTDALILCLKSLGIGKGDEVITVCNTFYATVGAIVAVGAKPVFCDTDSRYQINILEIEKRITKRTKAILPVHWAGASPDMLKIKRIAKKNNIYLIEDACMGIGAKINNKSPGTFGDVSAVSMHPLKSLNVMGDGGAVITNSKKIYDWIRCYRNHGMINRDNINFWGVNNRMQPLQAIVAMHGLKKINKVIKIRNANAKYLDKKLLTLNKFITLPIRPKQYLETFALYMIVCKKRNKLKNFLEKNNIEVKIHYPKPLHIQKASNIFGYKKGDFPIAEFQSRGLITIPIHQFLNKKDMDYIYNKIKDFYFKFYSQ